MSTNSRQLPPPISPVKWKDFSLSQNLGASSLPPSRDTSFPRPGHLTPQKKESMMDLKLREENRAARFKLRNTLVQELTNKMGTKYKKEILNQVDLLLSRKRNITQDDMFQLEGVIRSGFEETKTTTTHLPPTGVNLYQSRTQESNGSNQVSLSKSSARYANSDDNHDADTPLPIGTEWEQLTLYQTLEYDRISRENEAKKAESKRILAAQLAQQVEEVRVRRQREKAEDIAYAESVKRDVERFREEANQSLSQKHQSNISKLQDFKLQIENERKLKMQLKELTEIETKLELERIRAGIEYEQMLQKEKKEKEMKIHQETVKENEENNRQKILQKQKEQEEEIKRTKYFEERQRAEEAARHEAFQKRLEKIEKNSQLLSMKKQGEDQETDGGHERENKEEDSTGFFCSEYDEKMTKEKVAKLQEIKKENLERTKEKRYKEEERRQLEKEEGIKLKKESDLYQENEKKKRLQDQLNKKKYGLSLKKQIEDDTLPPSSAMTRPERSLNQRELKVISDDNQLHSRIAHRLRMKTAPANPSSLTGSWNQLALTRYCLSNFPHPLIPDRPF